jgi:thiol-disulfide isomerase/thioredoxin
LKMDILLAKRFSDSLKEKFDEVKGFVQIDCIKDTEVREKISAIYDQAEYLSRINTSNQINEEITENFINDLIEKHPNKILYIDFWATWCGPCMGELPYSNQLKNMFNENDVVFVYLANRSGETIWKKTIKERDIKGDHYLLTDKQFSNMSKTFEISGIPHYVLIDRKGNITSKDAPRPSSGDGIINSINELL